jgi:hypothetical protein
MLLRLWGSSARDKGRWLDGTVRRYAQTVESPSRYVVMMLPSFPEGSGVKNSEATCMQARIIDERSLRNSWIRCGRVERTNTSRPASATCPVAGRDTASVSTQAKLYVIPVWPLTRWMDVIRAWKIGWSGRFRVVLEGRTRVVLRNILIRAGHLFHELRVSMPLGCGMADWVVDGKVNP